MAEQFREALALAWQRALQALEDHQSTSLRFFAGKIAETQKGFQRGFPERLKEREEKDEEPKGDEVARDDRDVGSYGFIWIHMGSISGRSSNLCHVYEDVM